MNCKPGDLAVVVRIGDCPTDFHKRLMSSIIGRVVTVVSVYERKGSQSWRISEPFWLKLRGVGPVKIIGIDDDVLQPIRGITPPEAIEITKTLEAA